MKKIGLLLYITLLFICVFIVISGGNPAKYAENRVLESTLFFVLYVQTLILLAHERNERQYVPPPHLLKNIYRHTDDDIYETPHCALVIYIKKPTWYRREKICIYPLDADQDQITEQEGATQKKTTPPSGLMDPAGC